MLDISNNNWLFYNKFDWSKVFNKEWNLTINNNKFFLYSSKWNNFLNKNWLLSNYLFVNRNLSMTSNFNNLFLNISLYIMTFLNNNLFGKLFKHRFLYLDNNSLWFLTITMLSIINWLLYHNLTYLCNLMSFNYWFFYLNKLYLFLYNNMMDIFLYYFIFWLFIYFWYCLLDFEYFVNLFIYIFRYLFLYLDFTCLYL